jgi:hypothetical protein
VEGMFTECCCIPVCNNGKCDCDCCRCLNPEHSFTCGHCETFYRTEHKSKCMHFHPEPLLKDDSRMAVCEQCFRITCGVCKAPCSADRPVGPPPIGQD